VLFLDRSFEKEVKITRKCMFCRAEIPENAVLEVCSKCGRDIWGSKMFYAIIDNMGNAKDEGNIN